MTWLRHHLLINTHVCTWLLDVQFPRANAVDELRGFRGGTEALNQQVLVKVSDSTSGLQLRVRGCFCIGSLSLAMGVKVDQVLKGAAVCSLSDR